MFKLNNLRSPIGSNHAPKRRGKGIGSGLGKTGGKGHKGQKARAGGQVNAMFEGGQVSLSRRLPKVGFRSPLKHNKVTLNITELARFAGQSATIKQLVPKSLATKARVYLAIVGSNEPKAFPKEIEAHKVSPKAKEILELQGVKITIIKHMDGARNVRPIRVRKNKPQAT